MKNFGFPRNLRLLKPGDFRYVFENTRYKVFCPGFLLLAAPARQTETRLGFVIGKKNVKLAVNRNRYKRMFRESFRMNQQQLPAVDIIVLAVKGANQVTTEELSQHLSKAWLQLSRRVSKTPANPSPLD
ncbi:MAG: ribonuclease P protein component [Marinospirillum sp.]|uniref:ribonuclease P protein component n=1 Tax=Marinospirillum sp. TaxID=2183934 RepID=UPI001A03741F|nr:ribonuclease P protein component [Marinospirillum sp.]MBE0505142.1 ribonuclease P protein component [Marinospirillum sp.]